MHAKQKVHNQHADRHTNLAGSDQAKSEKLGVKDWTGHPESRHKTHARHTGGCKRGFYWEHSSGEREKKSSH